MKKRIIATILSLTVLTGCSEKVVYIQRDCPKIEKLPLRPAVSVGVYGGCVCDNNLSELFNLIHTLRRDVRFYDMQIEEYNKEFANDR